jgi:hypothetical protein
MYERRIEMKNGKKIVLLALVVILVASTVMAFTGPGKWKYIKRGQDATVFMGNAGISFTDSFYTGTVNVNRTSRNIGLKPLKNFQFTQDFLWVKFYDQNWNKIEVVTGPVYVFFKLSNKEQKALGQGRLGIYYWDTWLGQWRACPTFAVNGGTRAGCRIRFFGQYSLMFRDP